ncbi:MAG: PIN domain-containing protein [Candidatus Doudnabacteria bacterium]|nr:PIN domain-containing protein [Candidatus Doudnabacteria bacterium]
MYRVVIDTNLLIDAQNDDYSHAYRILDEVLAGRLMAVANRKTLEENRLISAKKVRDIALRDKLDNFFGLVNLVGRHLDIARGDLERSRRGRRLDIARGDLERSRRGRRQERVGVRLEDPEDLKLVRAAVAGEADFLITSDHHLLKLERVNQTRVVTPRAFWTIYEEETKSGWRSWIKQFISSQ